jgi:hypothetical protein
MTVFDAPGGRLSGRQTASGYRDPGLWLCLALGRSPVQRHGELPRIISGESDSSRGMRAHRGCARFVWSPFCCARSLRETSLDASLPRRDRGTAPRVSERTEPLRCSRNASLELDDDASVNLRADSKPPIRKRVVGPLWEVYRDALVFVVLWLVLLGLALIVLSAAAARARPRVPPLAGSPGSLSTLLSSSASGPRGESTIVSPVALVPTRWR